MQRIEAELEAVKADFRASKDQLEILGTSEKAIEKLESSGQVNSYGDVISRTNGTIITKVINLGQIVQPEDVLFSVADLSKLWGVAEIPEQQVAFVQKDQDVTIEVPALNKKIQGKIVYEGDVVNPETRTVMVRTEIDNADLKLKPDMLISMFIQSKKVSDHRL